MRCLLVIALVALLPSLVQARSGFFLGGVSDGTAGTNDYSYDLQRQHELERQRRLLDENNRMLRDQEDRQNKQDFDRIFSPRR